MTNIFREHPRPWRVAEVNSSVRIIDAKGQVVPLDAADLKQASFIASLANSLDSAVRGLVAAEAAFLWMESCQMVIEDGGTDAPQTVSGMLDDLREAGYA